MAKSKLLDKNVYIRLGHSLRYALYVIFHPIDGFWCLNREKKGSLAAANIIVALICLEEVMRFTLTDFQFLTVNLEYFNAFISVLSVIVPLLLWTVANWGFTTLMDGKGRLKEIYIGTAYAFTPYMLINFTLIILSYGLTYQEYAIYGFLSSFAVGWSILLVFSAMMCIHDYSVAKTFFSSFLTIVGIMIIVFLFLLFFSLISDGIAYFISLYEEIAFRII